MYGAKVSRQGFDVKTASDKQLAFSSEWPLLPIEAEGVFKVTNDMTQPVTIYNHGLGYPPVFSVYYTSDFYESGWYEQSPVTFRTGTECGVDSDNLVWKDYWYSSTPMYLYWKVFRRPITFNYQGPNHELTDSTKSSFKDYGAIVSKLGKSIGSPDLRDFGIRNDCRPSIIGQSSYGLAEETPAIYRYEITHNLGYRPIYWAYYWTAGNAVWRDLTPTYVTRMWVTTTKVRIEIQKNLWGMGRPQIALLIFKNTLDSNG